MRFYELLTEKIFKLGKEKMNHLMTPTVMKLDQEMKKNGFEIRIVGGSVRDIMIGKTPKDIDMATDALPTETMEVLDKADIRYEPTGLKHGTITAIIDNEPIEITTLRIDTNQDGRHADVEFTNDWKKDAERRDLTFNAMSLELNGVLHDYFGGVNDLKNGTAKFVGDTDSRIKEDYLRILRYFRFQGRLKNPTWNSETMGAIKRNASGLDGISGERIWMEMSKIFVRPSRTQVLEKMNEIGILDIIGLPNSRLSMLTRVDGNDAIAAMTSMLNNDAELEKLRSKWKFSNQEYSKAKFIIQYRDQKIDIDIAKRMMADPKVTADHVFALLLSIGQKSMVQTLKNWKPPIFPVNGNDLINVGVEKGPMIGQILTKLQTHWKKSDFKMTKAQLLNLVDE